ncbi:MAG TPA: DUF4157 domain-containing protein [Allosphingosinicella sp.]|jgi:hypothetical protein
MAGREAPARAHLLKQSAGEHAARSPPAQAQSGRCLGATAQLAALRRTLRHGAALQRQAGGAVADAQLAAEPRATAANRTGLPDRLKAGVEALSGVSLDGVKVHYNSSRPAELNAHAFAQGADIHLAPSEEQHLPHEAWHVVQQAQGRVKPTRQLCGGARINDEARLEREADAMGSRALGMTAAGAEAAQLRPIADCSEAPIQGVFGELADVNAKLLPTADFSPAEKLEIANWCVATNHNSNALRQVYANDYQHVFATTANHIDYTAAFDWSLAMHIDFGGAAHGDVDTPHLQAVQMLQGMNGSTVADLMLTKGGLPLVSTDEQWVPSTLAYNAGDNAVALSMPEARQCMADSSLNPVKAKIRPKLKAFAEDWATAQADRDSGAKAAREEAGPDLDFGVLGE